jgi:hypothetical protein
MPASKLFPKSRLPASDIHAPQSRLPVTLAQIWLGRTSIRTTAINSHVLGPDERSFARRMWRGRTQALQLRRAEVLPPLMMRDRCHHGEAADFGESRGGDAVGTGATIYIGDA